MANQEHVDIIKQGVRAWNKWRIENPTIRPDLSNANLQSINLDPLMFSETGSPSYEVVNLREVILDGADLGAAHLRHANLKDASLRGVNLRNAGLIDANLTSRYNRYCWRQTMNMECPSTLRSILGSWKLFCIPALKI